MAALTDNTSVETDAAVIVNTALAAAAPERLDRTEIYSVVVPNDGRQEIIDLERFQAYPRRATGRYQVASVEAFIDLTKRHHDAAATTVWVHPISGAVVAVLNDHGASQDPEWGDHRVNLQLLPTNEWMRWISNDGKLLDQETFAEHLQDGITEIADPPAADLLEIAQTMQGHTNASWKSGVSIRDGSVQIGYTEEATAQAGRDGNVAIPEIFTLVLAPFMGEEPVEVRARLRWRVPSGKLRIGYKLEQPERVVQNALEKIAARLRDEFPDVVFLGEPRTAPRS